VRAWRQLGAVVLWVVAVAIAGGIGAAALPAREAPPVTHTVTIDATSYTPARLAVRRGDTIEWVNKDLIPHTATARSGDWDSKALEAGASWRLTVKVVGTTDYACLFHPTMTGRIVVR
jgi:plastocyanin